MASHQLRWCALIAVVVWAAAHAAAAGPASIAEAVKARDLETVRQLLQQKADVQAPLPDGTTALHWAAHWDEVELARQLIAAGARPDTTDDFGVSPLWLACQNASPRLVGVLLEAGADRSVRDKEGRTPAYWCQSGDAETKEIANLLQAAADTKK